MIDEINERPPDLLPDTGNRPTPENSLAFYDSKGKPRFIPGCGRAKPRSFPAGDPRRRRYGMNGGLLPPGASYRSIEDKANAVRRHLENAVFEAKGEVSITDAAVINSALAWEKHRLMVQFWFRTEIEEMTRTQRLNFSEAIAKATAKRNDCISALNLDRPELLRDQALDALYVLPQESSDEQAPAHPA